MTEASPEDVAEQAAEVLPEPYAEESPDLALEVDPADAAQQAAAVDLDDDEPR